MSRKTQLHHAAAATWSSYTAGLAPIVHEQVNDHRRRDIIPGHVWIVATDKVLSGWGPAPVASYVAYPVYSSAEEYKAQQYVRTREDFIRPRITESLPRLYPGEHLSLYDRPWTAQPNTVKIIANPYGMPRWTVYLESGIYSVTSSPHPMTGYDPRPWDLRADEKDGQRLYRVSVVIGENRNGDVYGEVAQIPAAHIVTWEDIPSAVQTNILAELAAIAARSADTETEGA